MHTQTRNIGPDPQILKPHAMGRNHIPNHMQFHAMKRMQFHAMEHVHPLAHSHRLGRAEPVAEKQKRGLISTSTLWPAALQQYQCRRVLCGRRSGRLVTQFAMRSDSENVVQHQGFSNRCRLDCCYYCQKSGQMTGRCSGCCNKHCTSFHGVQSLNVIPGT
jgi:hypothetical protein